MARVDKFNPFVVLDKRVPVYPERSWWTDPHRSAESWYDHAQSEQSRMARSVEAASITHRCIDDLDRKV